MSLDDRAKAIVASNLTTGLHVEISSRRANLAEPGDPGIPKDWLSVTQTHRRKSSTLISVSYAG